MTYVRPPQITEREVSHLWVDERSMDDSRWEDCGPCAALECVIASGHVAPATHFEEETLRMQSGYGPLGGTDVPKLASGIASRYGLTVAQVSTLSQFRAALTPGRCAFVIVRPSRLPLAHVLRKYVGTGFAGLHFIYLANEGAAAPWMLDPAAPAGYPGDPLAWSDLAICYVGGAGVLPLATKEEDVDPAKDLPAMTGDIAPTPLYGARDGSVVISAAWPGFKNVGIYSKAAAGSSNAKMPHGPVGIRITDTGGVNPRIAWVDAAAVTFHIPGQAELDAAKDAGYAAAKTKAASAVQAI